jgi:hypothetical protein
MMTNLPRAADPAGSYPRPPVLNLSSLPTTYELTYDRSIFINLTQYGYHAQARKLSSILVDYPAHGTVIEHLDMCCVDITTSIRMPS